MSRQNKKWATASGTFFILCDFLFHLEQCDELRKRSISSKCNDEWFLETVVYFFLDTQKVTWHSVYNLQTEEKPLTCLGAFLFVYNDIRTIFCSYSHDYEKLIFDN